MTADSGKTGRISLRTMMALYTCINSFVLMQSASDCLKEANSIERIAELASKHTLNNFRCHFLSTCWKLCHAKIDVFSTGSFNDHTFWKPGRYWIFPPVLVRLSCSYTASSENHLYKSVSIPSKNRPTANNRDKRARGVARKKSAYRSS